jgi:hypothetical protein
MYFLFSKKKCEHVEERRYDEPTLGGYLFKYYFLLEKRKKI